jgi:hypothetical protein
VARRCDPDVFRSTAIGFELLHAVAVLLDTSIGHRSSATRSNFNNNGLAIGPVGTCYNSQF